MSPNEDQLRAALHDGEGDLPDAGMLIAGAVRARQERRRRITSIASGAAVVALLVTGVTFLVGNHPTGSGSADSADSGGVAYGPQQGGAGSPPAGGEATHGGNPNPAKSSSNPAVADGMADKAFGIDCPGTFPRLMLPGGGGTNQFGADEPLFPAPVEAIRVCSYGPRGSTVVTGPTAQSFATALDDAQGDDPLSCLHAEPQYAFYAISTSGTRLRVVTATPGCRAYQVTNGTAVRFLPFDQVDPLHITGDATAPHNEGSPPK